MFLQATGETLRCTQHQLRKRDTYQRANDSTPYWIERVHRSAQNVFPVRRENMAEYLFGSSNTMEQGGRPGPALPNAVSPCDRLAKRSRACPGLCSEASRRSS